MFLFRLSFDSTSRTLKVTAIAPGFIPASNDSLIINLSSRSEGKIKFRLAETRNTTFLRTTGWELVAVRLFHGWKRTFPLHSKAQYRKRWKAFGANAACSPDPKYLCRKNSHIATETYHEYYKCTYTRHAPLNSSRKINLYRRSKTRFPPHFMALFLLEFIPFFLRSFVVITPELRERVAK